MSEQIFADDVMSISIHEGAVRLDFVTYVPGQKEGEAQVVFRKRLVMSLPDFVRSYSRLRDIVEDMVEQGVLVRSEGPAAEAQQPGSASADVSSNEVSSPNFSRK